VPLLVQSLLQVPQQRQRQEPLVDLPDQVVDPGVRLRVAEVMLVRLQLSMPRMRNTRTVAEEEEIAGRFGRNVG
jgi:hypothetical protein